MDEVVCEKVLKLLVLGGEGLLQNGLQASKEGQGVEHVEGEATGERHQVLHRGVHGTRGRVSHHVAIHGTPHGRWGEEDKSGWLTKQCDNE